MSADASLIRRHPDGRRLAALLATFQQLESKSVDNTLELLDLLMATELVNKAQTARTRSRPASTQARQGLRPSGGRGGSAVRVRRLGRPGLPGRRHEGTLST
jgi:hypothetical protein